MVSLASAEEEPQIRAHAVVEGRIFFALQRLSCGLSSCEGAAQLLDRAPYTPEREQANDRDTDTEQCDDHGSAACRWNATLRVAGIIRIITDRLLRTDRIGAVNLNAVHAVWDVLGLEDDARRD